MNQRRTISNTQMPTLLGIGILLCGLVAGMVVFNQGTGVFLPRATEETTPKNVKITNVTERSFTVSFVTEAETTGFVKIVGKSSSQNSAGKPQELNMQSGDDRDQIRGTITGYPLHHITMTGLEADTNYHFVIGTDKGALYDDNGNKFVVKTAKTATSAPNAKTIYGVVTNQTGGPAKGSIVYIAVEGAGEMSQLVQESGSWAVPLANARTKDGASYASISNASRLKILVQGYPLNLTTNLETTLDKFESGKTITLGQDPTSNSAQVSPQPTKIPTPVVTTLPTVTPATAGASLNATRSGEKTEKSKESSGSGGLAGLLDDGQPTPTASPTAVVIDLDKDGHQTVDTQQPVIVGSAPVKTKITISVHSVTQIKKEITSDANGEFELDLAELGKELEPGEHVVEYSYTDPKTGKLVTKTHTFTVSKAQDSRLAQAYTSASPTPTTRPATTPTPTPITYGTGYPYGSDASQSASSTSSAATASSSATTATTPASKGGATASKSATTSALPVSGAISSTLTLIFGGLFFMLAGSWSLWVAKEIEKD